LVRRARRDFSVDIEVLDGTVIGIAAKEVSSRGWVGGSGKLLTVTGNVLDEYLDALPDLRRG